MDQGGTWHGGRPQPSRLCVRWGPAPPQKSWRKPPLQFLAHCCCNQTAGCIKMPLGMEVGLGPCHSVLNGNPAPLPKKGPSPPIFGSFLLWPNGWMHQDANWSGGRPQSRPTLCSMGTSYPQKKGHTHPKQFLAHVLWPNGWMDEEATWYGSSPRPRPHCIRRGPSYSRKGHRSPLFSAHVYCGHGRPSQLLLSSCSVIEQSDSQTTASPFGNGKECMKSNSNTLTTDYRYLFAKCIWDWLSNIFFGFTHLL